MSSNTLWMLLRYALFALGLGGLLLMVGFFIQASWVTTLVPWELSPLASIFLSSIAAASAFPILWLAWTRDYGALAGGGIDFAITFGGFAGLAFVANAANPRMALVLFGVYCLLGALVSVGLFFFGLRQPFRDTRAMPGLVRFSFAAFFLILTVVGLLLIFKAPNIFPWQLTPQQSVLYGWIFLGAATYFAFGFVRPVWANAQGQLLGFLAYDLVLIVPLVALFLGTEPYSLPSLLIYIAILLYSGGLAVYYLFFNLSTRINLRSM